VELLIPLHPSEILLDPFDVVLAEILTGLNLDKGECIGIGVFDPVQGTEGDARGLIIHEGELTVIEDYERVSSLFSLSISA
jgi:hypothetical protein